MYLEANIFNVFLNKIRLCKSRGTGWRCLKVMSSLIS